MINFLRHNIAQTLCRLYRTIIIPVRASQLRRKDKIEVLFLLSYRAKWKSESIYKAMHAHPRFSPLLLISNEDEPKEEEALFEYAKRNNYNCTRGRYSSKEIYKRFHPDIIFCQEPYGLSEVFNLHSLYCYVPYTFSDIIDKTLNLTSYQMYSWQIYYENEELAKIYGQFRGNDIRNSYGTGLPIMNEMSVAKDTLTDPWPSVRGKKRIIYAPHYSIEEGAWMRTATFLEFGNDILELAEKYIDQVDWAFKPHPSLRRTLNKVWGEARTNEYYRRWERLGMMCTGAYLELFKFSDALIHDCGSFTLDYIYSGRPAMYLYRDGTSPDNFPMNHTEQYLEALRLQRAGYNRDDIEKFIVDVINDKADGHGKERASFLKNNLTLPDSQSATENIINCILSKDAYIAY